MSCDSVECHGGCKLKFFFIVYTFFSKLMRFHLVYFLFTISICRISGLMKRHLLIPNCCGLVLHMIAVCFYAYFAKAFHIFGGNLHWRKSQNETCSFPLLETGCFAGLSYLSSSCIMGNADSRFWQGEGNASNKIISLILLLPHTFWLVFPCKEGAALKCNKSPVFKSCVIWIMEYY